MNTKILIVDGDDNVNSEISNILANKGYLVHSAKTGKEGIDIALREHPDLIVLEVSLSDTDGFSVCKTLRADGFKNPIIFLSTRTSEIDPIISLELGAQDYIRKPPSIKELLARIEVQLKKNLPQTRDSIKIDNLEIDLEKRKVRQCGEIKSLTNKEFQLLYTLAQCPNKVFTRNELLSNVWGWSNFGQTRTVDIHIGYLRKKFEENPRRPRLFQTIRGVGYTFNLE